MPIFYVLAPPLLFVRNMKFDDLVKLIRRDGCIVRVYDKETMKGSSSAGSFDISKNKNPTISIATKLLSSVERTRILLHEYAHFKQWKDGFIQAIDSFIDGWLVFDSWLSGKRYSEKQLKLARNCIVIIEYDAEIRTIKMSKELKIDIGKTEDYLNEAHSYISSIKYAFVTGNWGSYKILNICEKELTPKQVVDNLTNIELTALGA